ncbi:MAG: 1,4-alpha-glucan branching protein [Elusimicrobia bacterium HGW-Elusimicrobia-1]|nr:MAG: 1,4-alpha-glucan branching protein [Elusimicrobia bacterium HGW-Elusimicrobia-1]
MKNHFCLVLHSHIPYVRKAGVWPFGEEWLLEGILETYMPLLQFFLKMRTQYKGAAFTLGITPVLAEQLDDDYFKARFIEYADDRIRRAREDAARFSRSRQNHLEDLARLYERTFAERLESFKKIDGDIIGEIASLRKSGVVELITSAATHAYLPLLSRDSSVRAQIKTGIDSHTRRFGERPSGFWLPECAYRPAAIASRDDGNSGKALDEFLKEEGVEYFFVDTHAVEGGVTSVYADKTGQVVKPSNGSTSLRAYKTRAGVKVLVRNREAGRLVWSSDMGYPGDGDYREFHKKDSISGLQYWRITSKKTDMGAKEIYNPEAATRRSKVHAAHFKKVICDIFRKHSADSSDMGVVAPYDSELYGHWWHEGIDWLDAVAGEMASTEVGMSSVSSYLSGVKSYPEVDIPETSWGDGGGHYVWLNRETEWMWRMIHECELRMEGLLDARRQRSSGGIYVRALAQAAREKLLLESSDWEFLVTTRQAREYGEKRFLSHYNRFSALASLLEKDKINDEDARTLSASFDADAIFPAIDPEVFAARRR